MTDDKRDLSRALDEIYALRLLLASEARILEAHTDYKTFPKSRRDVAARSISRMREAARGRAEPNDWSSAKREYRNVTGSQTLTLSQWQAERRS